MIIATRTNNDIINVKAFNKAFDIIYISTFYLVFSNFLPLKKIIIHSRTIIVKFF